MNIAIIGIGLIGGSMALALKQKGFSSLVIGVESSKVHADRALELGLVDEVCTLHEAMAVADLVIIAIPVDAGVTILPQVLKLAGRQVILDVGSSKSAICSKALENQNSGRFVATHPMWGTEFSGPDAAVSDAFEGRAVVICNRQDSDADALRLVEKLYIRLGMHILYMDAAAHDLHAAYISHISHISSFALANTVLEKEKEDKTIFEMASGGFESTVRLAKSNVDMWVPIFMQNKENVLDVLNEHISQLRKFKSCLEKDNYEYLAALIQHANTIKRIL